MTDVGGAGPGPDRLLHQLERARGLGLLGPGPVRDHLDHAQGYVDELSAVTGRILDLGSGGGVPGLVILVARPDLEVVLLDASARRGAFLAAAVEDLGAQGRCRVEVGRAEVLGRGPLRGTVDAVVARSFGPPAATAECAAPFLRPGGLLIVSEPPSDRDRWPSSGLRRLGLDASHRSTSGPRLQVLTQLDPVGEEYPRRDGVPAKKPLF